MSRKATVVSVHNNDATTRIVLKKPPFFSYEPGQYIVTKFNGQDKYLSLASSPKESTLEVAVRPGDSDFKKYLSNLKPNDKINLSSPAGKMVLPRKNRRPMLLLAGGIGVTPFIGRLRYLDQTATDDNQLPVVLIHSNRYASEGAYAEELRVLDQEHDWFNYITVYTKESPTTRIDLKLLTTTISRLHPEVIMITGSHRFITGMQDILNALQVDSSKITAEVFCGYCPDHVCCCGHIAQGIAHAT